MNTHARSHLRSKSTGATSRVWEIADRLSQEAGGKAARKDIMAACVAEGINANTASTQHHAWQQLYDQTASDAPSSSSLAVTLQMSADGRLLVPLELRRQMMAADGGKVTAQVVDGELRVISPAVAIKRLQDLIRSQDQSEGSVVDELISDRRREANAE